MRSKIVMDTSAMVSLGHTDLIPEILSDHEIVITSEVVSELQKISDFDDYDGAAARKWLENLDHITVIREEWKGPAEVGLIAISSDRDLPLFIDDIRATRRMKGDIKWFFSVHMVFLLYYKGRITRDRAMLNIHRMRKERDWKDNAISVMSRILFA